jgi:hypothetical protein
MSNANMDKQSARSEASSTPTPIVLTATDFRDAKGNVIALRRSVTPDKTINKRIISGESCIVRAVNAHEEWKETFRLISEGINTAVDNEKHWSEGVMRAHLLALQTLAEQAIAKAETGSVSGERSKGGK